MDWKKVSVWVLGNLWAVLIVGALIVSWVTFKDKLLAALVSDAMFFAGGVWCAWKNHKYLGLTKK